MEQILTPIINVFGSVLVVALTFYFTKKNEIKSEWQKQKINHYKELLSAISDLAVDGTDKRKANMNFALASNTISLVAPQKVINALMEFHDHVKYSNQTKSPEKHDELLKKLLIEIRKDIGLSKKDKIKSLNFHLIGSFPIK